VTGKGPREQALSVLYAADSRPSEDLDLEGTGGRASRLAQAVWAARAELDTVIGEYAEDWRVERMPVVDRNVLRIGAYELLHTRTPVAVVIDQAVELAKRYSTTKSGSFVNGILDRMQERRPA
jgi:transcription antitermination protein NusB